MSQTYSRKDVTPHGKSLALLRHFVDAAYTYPISPRLYLQDAETTLEAAIDADDDEYLIAKNNYDNAKHHFDSVHDLMHRTLAAFDIETLVGAALN